MKELTKLSKAFMFISFLSGCLWIGSYLTRLFLTYQLFEPKDLLLKNYISQENLSAVLYTLLPAITTTFILYTVFIISFTVFLFISGLSLRKNGWLFISVLIIYITMPFEIYLMIIDYRLIIQLNAASFNSQQVLQIVVDRIKDLNSFPLVEIFSYFSLFYFVLFQPLKTDKLPSHED